MIPSQETCPEQFPHEETAMGRHLGTAGAHPADPRFKASPPPHARRLLSALAVPLLGAGLGVGGAGAIMIPSASLCAAAAQSGHVALVVELGSGSTTTRCVSFSGTSITGEQVLKASGLEYSTQSYGALGDALCQVENEPPTYTTCLPSSGDYWALFASRSGGAWKPASAGISSETFRSGDAAGLRYDPLTGTDPPPSHSPAGICATAAHSETGTPLAQASPTGPGAGLIAGLAVAAALLVLLALQLTLRRRRT